MLHFSISEYTYDYFFLFQCVDGVSTNPIDLVAKLRGGKRMKWRKKIKWKTLKASNFAVQLLQFVASAWLKKKNEQQTSRKEIVVNKLELCIWVFVSNQSNCNYYYVIIIFLCSRLRLRSDSAFCSGRFQQDFIIWRHAAIALKLSITIKGHMQRRRPQNLSMST